MFWGQISQKKKKTEYIPKKCHLSLTSGPCTSAEIFTCLAIQGNICTDVIIYFKICYFCHAGAVDELGDMPYYAEHCAAMLAVTYSSGQGMQRNIVSQL